MGEDIGSGRSEMCGPKSSAEQKSRNKTKSLVTTGAVMRLSLFCSHYLHLYQLSRLGVDSWKAEFLKIQCFVLKRDDVSWALEGKQQLMQAYSTKHISACSQQQIYRYNTRCSKPGHPSYKTAWAQTLSLLVKGERDKHMYWLQLDHEVQNQPESAPGHPSSHSFKSTSRWFPSAETMIAFLIFGNSLNLSNPWFWNISSSSSSTKPTQTYILWQWY